MIAFRSVLEAWALGPSEYDIFGVLCLRRHYQVARIWDSALRPGIFHFMGVDGEAYPHFGIGQACVLSDSGEGKDVAKNLVRERQQPGKRRTGYECRLSRIRNCEK